MSWKKQLQRFERNKEWKVAIELLEQTIQENPNDVEPYVQMIYMLHNILVEEDYLEADHELLATLLRQYFNESNKRFSDNLEYLFFIGKILYIAEWYFGLNDDFKPIEEKQAFKMQKKALDKEPTNILFEWAVRFSLRDDSAKCLAEEILLHHTAKVDWLKSKGFPGEYIIESITRSKKNVHAGVKE